MEEEVQRVIEPNAIAKPMADRKLTKRLLKLISLSSKEKDCLRRGLKDVQTRIRKGETGICILAGDVDPIDVYCHLPAVCEDKNIPYCFVAQKRDIADALGAKRPCIVALVRPGPEENELYEKCHLKLSLMSSK